MYFNPTLDISIFDQIRIEILNKEYLLQFL